MANARLQLTADVYMPLDGQWAIYLSGTIFDVALPHNLTPAHVTTVAESPNPVSKPTSVRGVRTR